MTTVLDCVCVRVNLVRVCPTMCRCVNAVIGWSAPEVTRCLCLRGKQSEKSVSTDLLIDQINPEKSDKEQK